MKTSKNIYSKSFSEYALSNGELHELQDQLLRMFVDIKGVCDENNIDYMLSGGTLLGAIRHQGFIPWDDDLDLMMTRENYNKFSRAFKQRFEDKYILAEPLCDKYYISKMPKVFLKNSVYVEIPTAGLNAFHMIFIDIFIIENVPDSRVMRKMLGMLYDFCFKASSVCADYLYPSPVILERMKYDKDLEGYYTKRRVWGAFFSRIGGMQFYLKLTNRIAMFTRTSSMLAVPSAISYCREVFNSSVFTEISMGLFCGIEVKIPTNYDVYLKNLYGDYMAIPPIESRELHPACVVKFPGYQNEKA